MMCGSCMTRTVEAECRERCEEVRYEDFSLVVIPFILLLDWFIVDWKWWKFGVFVEVNRC